MIAKFVMVALGGALGSMLRFAIGLAIPYKAGFPYATFLVNLLGSVLIGFAYVVIVEKTLLGGHYRELLMVGLLGALTTFSTFSMEVVTMMQSQQLNVALVYVVTSLIFCIVAAFIGVAAGRMMM